MRIGGRLAFAASAVAVVATVSALFAGAAPAGAAPAGASTRQASAAYASTAHASTRDGSPTVTTVVSGLASPRGIVFDGSGFMYVAQSGVSGPGPSGVTQSGSVSKYKVTLSGANLEWSTPFTSIYDTDPQGRPEAEGPEGLALLGSGCQRNPLGNPRGCQVLTVTSDSVSGLTHVGFSAGDVGETGKLVSLDGATGAKSTLSDVGNQNYSWTGSHSYLWNEFPDANPYAVLVTKGGRDGTRTFVVDAGSNTVDEVMPDGTARVISFIPNETSPGFRDSTPTCIAQGPDGMLYVGALDLVYNTIQAPGFGPGHSNVWRVNPNSSDWQHNATLWATGLTTVTACTFDNRGNFWAAEMLAPSANAQTPPGDLIRFPFAHPIQSLTDPHALRIPLPLPGGVAQGPDGAMYATTWTPVASPAGAVVRITAG